MLIDTILNHISERIESNQLSNDDCIKIIECVGGYLNIRTIPDYASENNISYNGVKKFRNINPRARFGFSHGTCRGLMSS